MSQRNWTSGWPLPKWWGEKACHHLAEVLVTQLLVAVKLKSSLDAMAGGSALILKVLLAPCPIAPPTLEGAFVDPAVCSKVLASTRNRNSLPAAIKWLRALLPSNARRGVVPCHILADWYLDITNIILKVSCIVPLICLIFYSRLANPLNIPIWYGCINQNEQEYDGTKRYTVTSLNCPFMFDHLKGASIGLHQFGMRLAPAWESWLALPCHDGQRKKRRICVFLMFR